VGRTDRQVGEEHCNINTSILWLIQRYVAFHIACNLVLMPRTRFSFARQLMEPSSHDLVRSVVIHSCPWRCLVLLIVPPLINRYFLIHNTKKVLYLRTVAWLSLGLLLASLHMRSVVDEVALKQVFC
jgi:hypothetical protein